MGKTATERVMIAQLHADVATALRALGRAREIAEEVDQDAFDRIESALDALEGTVR